MARPLFRWAGSKRQLVPELASYWNEEGARYVEPFAGSACLFFKLQPAVAILGDINRELINTYELVRSQPRDLSRALRIWRNEADEYYRVRALDPVALSEVERAARFIYLNRFCFNGLYRTNRSGGFNVPYGGRKTGALPSLEQLLSTSDLLSGAELVPGDFSVVLGRVRAGDFVYLDPPFSVTGRRIFKEYDRATFGESDLARLRRCLTSLDELGATFLLSYADSPEGSVLADGFLTRRISTRRNIAGFTGSRRNFNELLVTNRSVNQ